MVVRFQVKKRKCKCSQRYTFVDIDMKLNWQWKMNLSKAADCIRMSTASFRSLSLPLRVLIRCDSLVTSFLLLKHYGKSSLTIATRSSPIATGPVSTSSGWPFVIKSEQIQMTKRMMFFTEAMVDITHLPGALRQRV